MIPLLLTLAIAHAADCLAPASPDAISAKFDAAEAAYKTLEVEVFSSSLDEAALMLPCLDVAVTPAFAARYHRMRGLRSSLDRDPARATQSFAAARVIEPDYSFPTSLIPEGHSVRSQYASLDVTAPETIPVREPIEGWLAFDGARGLTRPTGWPSIVQLYDAQGLVRSTDYLFPSDPLPAYKAKPLPVSATARVPKPLSPKLPLAIGAGVVGVGAGVLYALAASSAQEFNVYDESYTLDDMERMKGRTNGLVYASVGAGVLAVAGGLGVAFVGHW